MATKKLKINFKMPTPTAAERLHAQQQKNRKAAGLPDPSEYKKKLDSMKSENYEEDDGPLSQEQLDEISAQLKASYVSGAKKQIKQSLPFTKKTDEYRDIAKNFIAKRQKGIAKANEEVEQIDELSKDTLHSYVKKSAPQAYQRSSGINKALTKAMYKTFDSKPKKVKEEFEQLDEMPESSMKTRDVHSHLKKSGWELARSKGGHDVYKHPKAKHSIPVPRHNQLKAPLIRGIMKASKVEESFRIGGMVGRGNIHQYDRNPGPKDGSELENVPFHAKTDKQKKLQNALNDLGKKMKETHPKLREDSSDDIVVFKKGSNVRQKIKASSYDTFKSHGFRKEAKDPQEYDYEGDMAKSDLRSIMHHAKELHDMIEDNTNLAEWCQSKITLAEDYLSTVANYMRSEMNEETVQEDAEQLNEVNVGDKVSFDHPMTAAPGKTMKKVGTVHKIEGDTAHLKSSTKYGTLRYTKKVSELKKEEVEIDEMIVVKTNKPIGTRVADIGPGGKEYNVKTDKAYDDAKKKQPQGAEFAAQRRKERLAKTGRMDESASEPTEGEMKGKQGYSRKAQIVMNAAKGKKADSPEKYQKDPELSSEIHKT
jgi:predicted RNA binding protein YcfA (HicA-like mRNA interferase family)